MTDNAFSRSTVDEAQLTAWQDAPGVTDAEPMGVSIVNTLADDETPLDLTLFGVEPTGFLSPEVSSGSALSSPNGIVLSETAKSAGVAIGTVVTLDRIDVELTVVGFTEGQATFGHVDVAYLPVETWRLIASNTAQPGVPTQEQIDALNYPYSSVVAISAEKDAADFAAIDQAAGTTTMSRTEAFNASPGYQAETMTLTMIQVFLYAICALVVGAFFLVWTIQRTHEVAVLRAVGASTGYLLRDSLAQAAILLFGFTAIGVAAGVGMGALMPDAMPFALEVAPIAIASAITMILGLFGATVAILRIARIDPISALGGNR